jgi:hypothetical protein
MKILELIQDRRGKLSPYKLSFLFGAFIFTSVWAYSAIWTRTVPEIPNSIALFMGVLGGTQLGRSFIQNKSPQNTQPEPNG